jgi:hypothetical protein
VIYIYTVMVLTVHILVICIKNRSCLILRTDVQLALKSFIKFAIYYHYCHHHHVVLCYVITFMQGIYNYLPETNHVSSVCSDASVLYLQSVLHVMLLYMLNMFCTFTSALPAVCVCSG